MANDNLRECYRGSAHFRELGCFLAAQTGHRGIRSQTLTWVLGCSPKELSDLLRKAPNQLGFRTSYRFGRYIFINLLAVSNEGSTQVLPRFVYQKIESAWRQSSRDFDTLIAIADLWRFLTKEDRYQLEPLVAVQDLADSLDFLGSHRLRLDLRGQSSSIWAALRGVQGSMFGCLSVNQSHFIEIEKSNRQIMREVLSRPIPRIQRGVALSLSAIIVSARILFRLCVASLFFRGEKRSRIVARGMEELGSDDHHWARSAEVLSCYWFDAELCVGASKQMVLDALAHPLNAFRLIRSLDWFLFTLAHLQNRNLVSLFYIPLIFFSRKLAPFLLPDILMHKGILLFYGGRCLDALVLQSHVEAELHDGNHPFNRDINLANALRSATMLGTPRFTNSIYNKIRIQSLFKGGLNLQRTELCIRMHRVREDGLSVHKERLWEIYRSLGDLPPIAKGSFEVLLAIAFMEARALNDARRMSKMARLTLNTAKAVHPFEIMLRAIERGSRTNRYNAKLFKSGTLNRIWSELQNQQGKVLPETVISLEPRTEIAFHLNEPQYTQDEQITMVQVLNVFFEAKDFVSLCQRFQESMRIWLPEFRYFIDYLGKKIESEAPFPLLKSELYNIALEDSDPIISRITDHGLDWTFVGKTSPNLKLTIILGAPSVYRRGGGARFLLANNIVNSFNQALLQMASRNLQVQLERQNLIKERDARLGQLASRVAHDIRSPLSALRMATQSAIALDPDRRNLILSVCERIDGIADQILGQYREFNPDSCFVPSQACAQILDEKRITFSGRPVEFSFHTMGNGSPNSSVRGDESAFKAILSNLIDNSIDAISEKGQIEVLLRPDGNFTTVSVRDNGLGMDTKLIEAIQSGRFISTKQHGHGLGLKNAFDQISKWGGDIFVSSTKGYGTVVRMKLLNIKASHNLAT